MRGMEIGHGFHFIEELSKRVHFLDCHPLISNNRQMN